MAKSGGFSDAAGVVRSYRLAMGEGRNEQLFFGQVRYRGGTEWVVVSTGRTRGEAVTGASAAFFDRRHAVGRGPIAVRVVSVEAVR
jgi:hypothetical protein